MLIRILVTIVLVCSHVRGNVVGSEPELAMELRPYAWMVGDWRLDKIWTQETAHDPRKTIGHPSNPDVVYITVGDGGNALQLDYEYDLIVRDRDAADFGKSETIEVHCRETLKVRDEAFTLSGKIVRKHAGGKRSETRYTIHCREHISKRLKRPNGTNVLKHVSHRAVLYATRDDFRSNPEYKPFTPRDPNTRTVEN